MNSEIGAAFECKECGTKNVDEQYFKNYAAAFAEKSENQGLSKPLISFSQREYETAVPQLEEYAAQNPSVLEAWTYLALCYAMTVEPVNYEAHLQKAIDCLNHARQLNPEAEIFHNTDAVVRNRFLVGALKTAAYHFDESMKDYQKYGTSLEGFAAAEAQAVKGLAVIRTAFGTTPTDLSQVIMACCVAVNFCRKYETEVQVSRPVSEQKEYFFSILFNLYKRKKAIVEMVTGICSKDNALQDMIQRKLNEENGVVPQANVTKHAPDPVLPVLAPSQPSNKTGLMLGLIALLVITAVAGWMWRQKYLADELEKQTAQKNSKPTPPPRTVTPPVARTTPPPAVQTPPAQQEQKPKIVVQDPMSVRAQNCTDFANCYSTLIAATFPRNVDAIKIAAGKIEAMSTYKRGDTKKARELNQEGLVSFNKGDFADAVIKFQAAGNADPADIEVWANLGLAAIKNGQMDVARPAFGHALLLNSRRTSTWGPIAEMMSLQNEIDASARALVAGFTFSSNPEKTLQFYRNKSETETNNNFKQAFKRALQMIAE